MRRRCVSGVALVAAAVGLLSGCTAVDLPLAGVRVGADGMPYALLRPCGDDSYRTPGLDGSVGDDGPVTTGWSVKRTRLSGDADFPLFSPPAAWDARHRGARRLLPQHHYTLGFGHYVTGDSYNGIVTFTTADLDALTPGQVWADSRAMSRHDFEKLAEDSC
ncbi:MULTISPECIES: hypothetical protein [Streptomyces]|uniref:hypothetical protein n=1 Tax=Streptomyces TaxID=1883 RepID=UPI001CED278E|nr:MULTISPECIES: hypothetical protein [Streptomyces]